MLPTRMQVILGAVQQSQHLHLHQYCIAARTTPILLVNEVRRFLSADPGDHRCRVDDLGALGNLAECNEPPYDLISGGRKEIRD